MNIQIFGINKSFDTKKAERYFKERRIKYQFVDLNEKGLSKGELKSVEQSIGFSNLMDKNSKEFVKLNAGRITTESIKEELILNHPKLLKMPVVRNGRQATVGYCPDVWKTWE